MGQAPASQTPLTLGSFTFQGFEVPEEIEGLGTEQIAARHVHPGGVVGIQTFGPAPFERISWSGILFNTSTASIADRQAALTALAAVPPANGGILLTYASFQLMVIVKHVRYKPRNQFYLPYEIELWPYVDQSAGATQPAPSTSSFSQLAGASGQLSNVLDVLPPSDIA